MLRVSITVKSMYIFRNVETAMVFKTNCKLFRQYKYL